MRAYKRWSQYSIKWQNARRREGLEPKRWNRWQRLSDKTRVKTDPYEYAKGVSVLAQSRKKLLDSLTQKVRAIAVASTPAKFKPASLMTIRKRLDRFPTSKLTHFTKVKDLYRAITIYNRAVIAAHGDSELFYHGGAAD
jgi:hypothetical protein